MTTIAKSLKNIFGPVVQSNPKSRFRVRFVTISSIDLDIFSEQVKAISRPSLTFDVGAVGFPISWKPIVITFQDDSESVVARTIWTQVQKQASDLSTSHFGILVDTLDSSGNIIESWDISDSLITAVGGNDRGFINPTQPNTTTITVSFKTATWSHGFGK